MSSYKVEICGVNTAKLPVLKEEEKDALFARIKQGDAAARETYIKGNLRLVLSVIKRFSGNHENVDDLFQIGCIGLIKSIDNFNPALGVKFSTYAVPMIIGEIRRYLRDNNSIRVSRSLRDTAYKAIHTREILAKTSCKEPTLEEIAKVSGLTQEEIVFALDAIQSPVSLYDPVYTDGGDTLYVMDQISDKKNREDNWIEELSLNDAMNHLNDPARILDCLQKIDDSSRHLLELINEVLDMSKIESGDTTLHEEPLYLSKTMKIVDGVCRQAAVDKQQIFDMDIEEIQDDHVLADPVRLRQVLINLISNGVKYTPEHGCVQVKVAQGNSFAEGKASYSFEVKDNGIGMSEEFQKKLFEPFSREDNSMTNATQGTGLGLSIAKSIIAQMGGSIEVKSIQGKGTTFLVRLDLKLVEEEKEADQALLAAEAGEEKKKDPGFLKGRRIMLVEDNELNREIAYELLSESGLIVDVAENGQEAIKLLGIRPENYYELIFMDIQMPVMNGYEATANIRAGESDYWKTIPVIAMTANVFQEDESRAAECGMSDYVTKPIDMNVIYSVLEKWLRGQKG